MRIDLHAHSTASDGTDSPTELVRNAKLAGLDVVAITDHDTTAGWDEAGRAADEVGIALVRGIEVSCKSQGVSVHVLGYLHDPDNTPLREEIDRSRDSRVGRAERIVKKLAAQVPLSWDQVTAQVADGATIGRPHIADAMVAAGIVADRDEAFREWLYDGSPYYESHYAVDPVQAVELIRAAGGVAVMAHPFAAKRGRTVSEAVIESMAEAGLFALEAHHLDHTPEQEQRATELARRLGLRVTGSSDYHGDGKINRLGDRLTDPDVFEALVAQPTHTPVLNR